MQSQETNNSTGYNVRRLTQLSVLLTIAIIIFVLELQLPPLTPIPGIKMGLSNIITLVIILLYNKKDAFTVLILRIVISSIFAGQMTSFLYSIAGGIFSFAVMSLFSLFLKKDKLWVISAFGAIGHNLGQIRYYINRYLAYSFLFSTFIYIRYYIRYIYRYCSTAFNKKT